MATRSGTQTRHIAVRELNSHLVCPLCLGYYIDATTTVDCIHSFCRSCILRHLQTNNFCPVCDAQLHKTRPLLGIRPDRTLQTLVYKLVPNLYYNEMRRRHQFFKDHSDHLGAENLQPLLGEDELFSAEDSMSLSIEYYDSESSDDEDEDCGEARLRADVIKREDLPHRRYLQCPAAVSIRQLKKFLLLKYGLSFEHRIDIIYMGEVIPDHFTLMDVAYTFTWKRVSPMMFSYRIFNLSWCSSEVGETMSDCERTSGELGVEAPVDATQTPSTSEPECANSASSSNACSVGAEATLLASELCSLTPDTPDDHEEPPSKKPRLAGTDGEDESTQDVRCFSSEVVEASSVGVHQVAEENTSAAPQGEVVAGNEAECDDTAVAGDAPDHLHIHHDASSTRPEVSSSSSPGPDIREQAEHDQLDSVNSVSGNDFNDPDEDEHVLKIMSTEEEDYDDTNADLGDDETKTKEVPEYIVVNEKDTVVVEEEEDSKPVAEEKVVITEVKSKHKEGRKKSKHKSKHHHQRNDESTTRKRKTLRAEIISTPTVHQDPEDVMKLKVKLSPTSNPVITGYSSSFNSSHHKHHHHHSKHHHSKHHHKQQNSDSSGSSNRSNGEASSSTKERLLQMRAVRRKNSTTTNKNSELVHPDIEEFPSSKSKKSPIIMPPSSITVSKVTVSEKRKGDLQKSNSENESKRPSLEIMLVNAPPSSQAAGHHSIISNSSTGSTKQANVSDNETSRQSDVTMTTNVNMNKNVRQAASTIPLMRIKKQVSSVSIKPPSGLTITPKISTVSSKVTGLSKASPGNKVGEHTGTHSNKDDKSSEDRTGAVEQNIRHDDIGALDLSGKSSRCKDIPGSSPSPGLEICQSNSSSNSSSPGKATTSSSHQSILSIAHNLVHKQLTSLQQQRTSNNSSPLSAAPCSSAKTQMAARKLSPDRGNCSPQRSRNSPNNAHSSNTAGLAPLAMSNLQTLSDTAVHIRNLMAAQGTSNNVRMNISKQQMLAANLKMASAHSAGMQARTNSSYAASCRVSPSSPSQHPRYQQNSASRSPTTSQQYSVPAPVTTVNSTSSSAPLRIPVPPSPLNKALSSVSRGGGSVLNSRNSVSLPRLHDLFTTTTTTSAARGRGFPNRSGVNVLAKPGPNQAVRHIPNPSALMFRQNRQNNNSNNNNNSSSNGQQQQSAGLQVKSPAGPLPANSGNSNKVLYNQNQNFVGSSKTQSQTHDTASGISSMTSASSIRKMENMTRNIEKVAAGLTVRAVEANMNNKL